METVSINFSSLDPIPVTIGLGGNGGNKETNMRGTDGEASSFGEYLTALGGTGGAGYNNTGSMDNLSPGTGGTSGGRGHGKGAGGGGGYIIGCNIRGNGGDSGYYWRNSYAYPGQDGIGTGGGGAGEYFTNIRENAAITMGGPGKGGPLGGGGAGQDGGPGSGVVVVTW